MKHPPQRLIPVVVIASLITAGYFLDRSRAAGRSSLTGTFESQPSRLAPKTAGRVAEILVHEGEVVHAGQILIKLAAPEITLDNEAAKELANQATARLAESQAGSRSEEIARQTALVQEATANLQKLQNGALPEEIAAARHRIEQAQAKYLELRRGSRKEDIAQVTAAVAEAQARLDIVRRGPNPEERRQLEAQLRAAESDLRLAATEYDRKRKLGEEGAIAGAQVDAARNTMQRAQAARDAAALAVQRASLGAPKEEVRQAESALDQAKARLSEINAGPRKEEVAAALAELNVAQANLKLVQRGPRAEDIEAAQARVAQATATLQELQAGTRKEEIDQANAAAKAAKAQAGSAGQRQDDLVVRAPKDGVIERILVADGDLSGPASPAIQFSDPRDIWLRIYLPEAQLPQVAAGTVAHLKVDGIGAPIEAVVESIATQGEFTPANLQTPEERGKQVFAVRLRLQKPDTRIKAGMAATVTGFGATS